MHTYIHTYIHTHIHTNWHTQEMDAALSNPATRPRWCQIFETANSVGIRMLQVFLSFSLSLPPSISLSLTPALSLFFARSLTQTASERARAQCKRERKKEVSRALYARHPVKEKSFTQSFHTYEWVMSRTWESRAMKSLLCGCIMLHLERSLARTLGKTPAPAESDVVDTYWWVVQHVRMSPVARTNESCSEIFAMWMSHVAPRECGRVMSHLEKSRRQRSLKKMLWIHVNEWFRMYEWVMSHVRESRAVKCLPCGWVMSHLEKSRHQRSLKTMSRIHVNEWFRTYEWVMSHVRESRVTRLSHIDEACRTYEWFMPHVWAIDNTSLLLCLMSASVSLWLLLFAIYAHHINAHHVNLHH